MLDDPNGIALTQQKYGTYFNMDGGSVDKGCDYLGKAVESTWKQIRSEGAVDVANYP